MAFLITIFELIKSLRKDTESWTSPSMDKLMAYLQSADGIRQVIAILTANCFFQWRLEQAIKFRIVDNVVALSKVLHCTSRHLQRRPMDVPHLQYTRRRCLSDCGYAASHCGFSHCQKIGAAMKPKPC